MGLFSSSKTTASHIADCYTRSDVPGRTIEKSIGLVHFTKIKDYKGSVPEEIEGIFQSLVKIAKQDGANAVVNVRMEISSNYSGDNDTDIFLVAYGEAVILV